MYSIQKINTLYIFKNMPLIFDIFLNPNNKILTIILNPIFHLQNIEKYKKNITKLYNQELFIDYSNLFVKINSQRFPYNWIGEKDYKLIITTDINFEFEKLNVTVGVKKYKWIGEIEKRNDSHLFEGKTGIMTLFKNENNFLLPWLQYYDKMGIDYFFIYNNNPINKKLYNKIYEKFNNRVIFYDWDFPYFLHEWPPCGAQLSAMNHNLHKYKNMKWIGYFDLDEYIIPLKNNNLQELLNNICEQHEWNNLSTLEILCMWFGCGRKTKWNPQNFTQKMIYCKGSTENQNDKNSIAKINAKCFHNPLQTNLIGVHKPVIFNKKYISLEDKLVRFNHYFMISSWGKERHFLNCKEKECNCDILCVFENVDILKFFTPFSIS